jgi:F-type H+-transporting ATPase subunit delta
MSDLRVASRYAKSFIDLVQPLHGLATLDADVQLISTVFKENKEFVTLIKSPIVRGDKKIAIFDAIFKGKVSDITLTFFKLVSKKHREASLPHIAEEVHRQINDINNIQTAVVKTASPISQELRNEFVSIVEKLTNKKVELTEKVDETLIGGYVLSLGDRQLDESIKTKLGNIKLKFSSNPYISKL